MKKESTYLHEITANHLIRDEKAYKGMSEEDMIVEIYNETLASQGKVKARYLMNVDKDYLSDCISEINDRLKIEI